jgi:hypothetical protein
MILMWAFRSSAVHSVEDQRLGTLRVHADEADMLLVV